ncbi:MAG: cytochrome c oxidase subunit II [Brevundimonas sp.]|nr:MAG: cytochrome c oxidase subunit II [Brevundimonas sp.]
MGMGTRARGLIGGLAGISLAVFSAGAAWAKDNMGQPTDGALGLQPAASPLKVEAHHFHDLILLPIIVAISLLVLGLLIWICIRYNKKANPVPAKWSHNTLVEIIWTVVPVLILVFISLFSFKLLFNYHDDPPADVTIKVTGNQWNWQYEYPDQAIDAYYSNMLPEDEIEKRGMPHSLYRLAADEPMVVPLGKNIELLITGADVIHAVALPAFGLKTDAVPGRINKTWFRATQIGTFYGQCSELCGVDHAFMPIQINVVSEEDFEAWVASKGGSMTPPAPAAAPVATAAPAAAGAVVPPAATAASPAAPAPAGAAPASASTASATPAPAAPAAQ